jgi:hypothetical protein
MDYVMERELNEWKNLFNIKFVIFDRLWLASTIKRKLGNKNSFFKKKLICAKTVVLLRCEVFCFGDAIKKVVNVILNLKNYY